MAQRHLYILSGEYQSLLPLLLTLKPRNIDTVGKNPKLLLEYKHYIINIRTVADTCMKSANTLVQSKEFPEREKMYADDMRRIRSVIHMCITEEEKIHKRKIHNDSILRKSLKKVNKIIGMFKGNVLWWEYKNPSPWSRIPPRLK